MRGQAPNVPASRLLEFPVICQKSFCLGGIAVDDRLIHLSCASMTAFELMIALSSGNCLKMSIRDSSRVFPPTILTMRFDSYNIKLGQIREQSSVRFAKSGD